MTFATPQTKRACHWALISLLLALGPAPARASDTAWMTRGQFGIFMHYQYRILLGYSVRTQPQFPNPSQMTAAGWNRFVDGFDANGFAFSWGRNEQVCIRKGVDDFTGGDTWSKQDLARLTPAQLPPQGGLLWHGKIYCGNVYHGQGDANQFSDEELIAWINTCNRQGGVCTLDWPFDPKTGLLKEFGFAQLKRVARAVKKDREQVFRPTANNSCSAGLQNASPRPRSSTTHQSWQASGVATGSL